MLPSKASLPRDRAFAGSYLQRHRNRNISFADCESAVTFPILSPTEGTKDPKEKYVSWCGAHNIIKRHQRRPVQEYSGGSMVAVTPSVKCEKH